mmetsp:Transcript_13505/g.20290  ORF Transcript_13505/g.20290 Transcript_13505/m.20290 type:complete len:252 (+) Transcript_13505:113-868(+)
MFRTAFRRVPVYSYHIRSFSDKNVVVYGHYVSQPSRAVLWLLKMHDHPFDFVKVEPLAGDTKKPDFKSLFPLSLAPAINDNGFYLAEGSAIMQYLCEKNNWEQYWPIANDTQTRQRRARIAEYLSHHHHSTRLISHRVMRPYLQEIFGMAQPSDDAAKTKRKELALKMVGKFEKTFLSQGKFVSGMSEPTIADILAYCEVYQLVSSKLLSSLDDHSTAKAWCEEMQKLPYHDDVHRTVTKVGEIAKSKNLT